MIVFVSKLPIARARRGVLEQRGEILSVLHRRRRSRPGVSPTCSSASSIAWRSSAGVWKRSAGSFSSILRSSIGDRPGADVRSFSKGGGFERCWLITCAIEPANGVCPASMYQSVTPSE